MSLQKFSKQEDVSAVRKALADWLALLERRHPRAIDLGLDRVAQVWRAMGSPRPATRVITVAGTNGKGSTVALVEAAARAQGWRVGAYTSPHLLRYNERARINGADVDDAGWVAAFEAVESVRGEVSLTYFEFGTLAAFWLMARAGLDLAVLEVGLGGRLDAVNLVDADVAVVTTIALDHQDWLGSTRAAIAGEKAGIARSGRPLLVGERDAEPALLAAAAERGARVLRLGHDYDWRLEGSTRLFRIRDGQPLPLPDRLPLAGEWQWDNAATALAALHALVEPVTGDGWDWRRSALALARVVLPGRLQQVAADPDIVVDIGHNPQAALALADWLWASPHPTDAVFSALADKDVAGLVEPFNGLVGTWHLAGMSAVTPRGLSGEAMAERLAAVLPAARLRVHETIASALAAARTAAPPGHRILVFGSFYTVAEALRALTDDG